MLAAAVADFYVPELELPGDKIQSRAYSGLQLSLQNTPKMLGFVKKRWCPLAMKSCRKQFLYKTPPLYRDAYVRGARRYERG